MHKKIILSSLVASVLLGCGVAPMSEDVKKEEDKKVSQARAKMNFSAVVPIPSSVNETHKVMIPVMPLHQTEVKMSNNWLANKRIMLSIDCPISMSEVVKMFWSQGINISSTLPLDSYTYGGLGVNNTDADTALKLILSSVGLDYSVDNVRKIVLIKPMETRSWYLNLGKRSSTYSTGSGGGNGGGGSSSNGGGQSSQNASVVGSSSQNSGGSNSQSNTGVSISDNFWDTLKTELTARLSILVPTASKSSAGRDSFNNVPLPSPLSLNQPIPTALTATAPVAPTSADTMFVSKQVGAYSLNPETGAVNIQAPHWILDGIDTYMNRIQEMYNTDITFTGELVMLSTDAGNSEGLDISSFGRFAQTNYGFGIKNNSLGGVTISVPDSGIPTPSITAGKSNIASTLLGLTNLKNGFQIFNAYLSNHGSVTVVQKPVLTTTSGVPVEFSKIVTEYFNSVSQQATSANVGGAATATQNTLVPVDFGTVIKINPRFDISTGLIRAQISLYQTLKSGTQIVNQSLSSGNNLQQIGLEIPIVTKLNYSGETLLKDGDMIIIGGQQDDSGSTTSNGVTGLKDTFMSGVFGNKGMSKRTSTYYFALRVTTYRRDSNPNQ